MCPTLVNEINSYFRDGFRDKNYASLWEHVVKPAMMEKNLLVQGPKKQKAILLSRNNNTHLWWGPAGNFPCNPELIVLGQATSKNALDYMMDKINRAPDENVDKLLASSIYRGKMLSNLGVMLNFLGVENVLSTNALKEGWVNIKDCKLGGEMPNPIGSIFEGCKQSRVMFTQACMHCATYFQNDKHNDGSRHLKQYLAIYERTFPNHFTSLIMEKFFSNSDAKLMIVLGKDLFNWIRNTFFNCSENWADFSQEEPPMGRDTRKVITWIYHPSPALPFYNRDGIFDVLNNIMTEKRIDKEINEDFISGVCESAAKKCRPFYKIYINQLRHHIWLKVFLKKLLSPTSK